MAEVRTFTADERSPIRRIVDFPLIAMVIASALFIAASATATWLGTLLPPMTANASAAVKGAIAIALMLAVYKLVMVHLGERPRDDLPVAAAPRGLAVGLLTGFLLFCALVGIAALFDVYNIVGPGDTRELVKDLIGMTVLAAFMEELLFRGILFRWIEAFAGSWAALAGDVGAVRPCPYFQRQRDVDLVAGDHGRSRRAAWRSLYAGAQPVGADGAARCVEFHPGVPVRRTGVRQRHARAGAGQAVGAGAALRRAVRARGLDDRRRAVDPARRFPHPARRRGAAISSRRCGSGTGERRHSPSRASGLNASFPAWIRGSVRRARPWHCPRRWRRSCASRPRRSLRRAANKRRP